MEISGHATARIKQRRITRSQIRNCLVKGQVYGVDLGGRKIKRVKFGKRVLEVIYIEKSRGYLIVTAYWRNVWP